jgi:predicted nucleotidyltransferase component of viral defense system
MKKQPADLAASVSRRLLNLARAQDEDYNLLLIRYACERLLYRLSISPYADRFVLKGALLFALWTGHMHRPTRDLDMLGMGDVSSEALESVFRALCGISVEPDGLQFNADAIRVEPIREEQEYQGNRVHLSATLGTAIVAVHIDVGAGDAVIPSPEKARYPTLLDFPAPELRIYPKETVVAEKLHAMVTLGMVNSRMKDFYDLWVMARQFPFDGELLVKAVTATFARRGTSLPADEPIGLTDGFALDSVKQMQWRAFLNRSRLDADAPQLVEVVGELHAFLLPVIAATHRTDFDQRWLPGGPWR